MSDCKIYFQRDHYVLEIVGKAGNTVVTPISIEAKKGIELLQARIAELETDRDKVCQERDDINERSVRRTQRMAEHIAELEAREAAHDEIWAGTIYSIDIAAGVAVTTTIATSKVTNYDPATKTFTTEE